MAASRYRIVLRGRLSKRFESAFDGMTLEHGPNRTVLVGDVRDQAQLYGLLDRLQELGIELVAVEPADISDGSSETGAGLLSVIRNRPVSAYRSGGAAGSAPGVGDGQPPGAGRGITAERSPMMLDSRNCDALHPPVLAR